MPEGILKFNLPEEREEFETAVNAPKWKGVVWEFDQELRKVVKYSDPKTPEEETVVNTYEKIRDKLWEIIKEEDLSLW